MNVACRREMPVGPNLLARHDHLDFGTESATIREAAVAESRVQVPGLRSFVLGRQDSASAHESRLRERLTVL